jgi:hypothetical protein
LDRLRGARNPETQNRNEGNTPLPFIQIQRLEAILPINSNVDAVLESLFKLGFDRYGKNVRIDDYSDRAFSGLTTYRFSKLKTQLTNFTQRCLDQHIKAICAGTKGCTGALSYGTVTSDYITESGSQTQTFTLNGGHIEFANGNRFLESTSAAPITFEFSGQFLIQQKAARQ